ncbi:hypothetical protein EX895_005919 [Sporisorium graminicola]|uniref:Uncharacterized protein n=1 Tax=Sporisorium graminicola TaxID=280036 RepID=A0A4V6ET24_9BASI|nr:hypothetical protein EX895_005919 [Sporisorium graminicola]TKY84839.1 hypothetical protein EX895_005919 [Sporisorium graminicola]
MDAQLILALLNAQGLGLPELLALVGDRDRLAIVRQLAPPVPSGKPNAATPTVFPDPQPVLRTAAPSASATVPTSAASLLATVASTSPPTARALPTQPHALSPTSVPSNVIQSPSSTCPVPRQPEPRPEPETSVPPSHQRGPIDRQDEASSRPPQTLLPQGCAQEQREAQQREVQQQRRQHRQRQPSLGPRAIANVEARRVVQDAGPPPARPRAAASSGPTIHVEHHTDNRSAVQLQVYNPDAELCAPFRLHRSRYWNSEVTPFTVLNGDKSWTGPMRFVAIIYDTTRQATWGTIAKQKIVLRFGSQRYGTLWAMKGTALYNEFGKKEEKRKYKAGVRIVVEGVHMEYLQGEMGLIFDQGSHICRFDTGHGPSDRNIDEFNEHLDRTGRSGSVITVVDE